VIDIHFYRKVFDLKQRIMRGELHDQEAVWSLLEEYRRQDPVVYNIETTNACNMRCEMCPRTTMMTRSIDTISLPLFTKIIDQLRPYTAAEWNEWTEFVEKSYGIRRDDMSENHFFLHIIPKVIVLHGYGDPLLDRDMPARVRLMSERGIPSYFSCNPANIDLDRSVEMFANGLGYIKYSIESTDDLVHKKVRGQASNFTEAYDKICKLLEIKAANNYGTVIVITMLNLNRRDQAEEFERLREAFAGKDVYLYLKSQDQQWYQDAKHETQSIHWREFCQFPWSSMTVKSNGECAMCVEDFNNEIILGDANLESMRDIWNGEKYRQFRRNHFELPCGIKCTEQCDMKLVGSLVV
jgi:wyosine [tRNA(Phe)-imidazoG37] synthetase (radical SAM superfamily)